MKHQDYELLSQYLDAELPAAATSELRLRLMAEPELRATYDRMRGINDDVHKAFNAPGADAVPQRIVRLLQNDSSAVNRRAGWGFAVAASLLAATGLLMNPEWRQSADKPGDTILNAALDTTPSRGDGWDTLSDGRKLRPVLSFAHRDGSWCREYLLLQDSQSWRGVACRSQGQWNNRVLDASQVIQGSSTGYRPAEADDVDAISAFIATNAAGIALSRKQESEQIEANWQQ